MAVDGTAWVDGNVVPIGQARIPILDWGFLHSDATYDVVHVWEGRFFRLQEHLDRFARSLAGLKLRLPFGLERVREICHACVAAAGLRSAYVEIICTRGLPQPGSRDPRLCDNRFYAFAIPFVWLASAEQRERGLHLVVSGIHRIPPGSVDPVVKNYHWIDFTRGLFEAYERGGETCVLTDGQGRITEGPGFNVFAVTGDRVATPQSGVLHGITRRTAMELARERGLQVVECALREADLRKADEVFVTSTAGGIIPVTRINGSAVGEGGPGPVAQALQARYWALHRDPRYSEPARHSG